MTTIVQLNITPTSWVLPCRGHAAADKRWVVVTPNPESDCNILLARASNEAGSLYRQSMRYVFSCSFRQMIFGAITMP
jgi:hypothetical protein